MARSLLTALAGALCCALLASPSVASAKEGGASMTVEGAVSTGRLPNGLAFHVTRGGTHDGKISIMLGVRAGGFETPGDYGQAHVVEHIVIEKVRDIAGRGSVYDRVAAFGGERGTDINAVTGPRETFYFLRVPAGDPAALAAGLDILEDWVRAKDFTDEEVDRGRKTVIEEGRRASLEGNGIDNVRRRILFPGHPQLGFQLRSPVDLDAPPAAVRALHARLYHPGNMAVTVSGAVDSVAVAAMLRARLADVLPGRGVPVAVTAPMLRGGHYVPDGAAMADEPIVTISFKYRSRLKGPERMRDQAVQWIADRLFEAAGTAFTRGDDAPLTSAGVQSRDLANITASTGVELFVGSFVTKPGRVTNGIEAALGLLSPARRGGFTTADIDRARLAALAALDNAPPLIAEDRSEAWLRRFLDGRVDPDRAVLRSAIATIPSAEVNARLRRWLDPANRDIFIYARSEIARPGDCALAQIIARAATAQPARPETRVANAAPLLVPLPEPALAPAAPTLTRDGELWTARLPRSGATFVYRKTAGNRVAFYAVRQGGFAALAPADRGAARAAFGRVASSGLGGLDRAALDRYLADGGLSVRPFVGDAREGLSANGPATKLSELSRLAGTYLAAPQCDPVGHEKIASALPGAIDGASLAESALSALIERTIGQTPLEGDDGAGTTSKPAELCAAFRSVLADTRGMVIAAEGPLEPAAAYAAVEDFLDIAGSQKVASVARAAARATSGKRYQIGAGDFPSASIALVVKRPTTRTAEGAGGDIAMKIVQARLMERLRTREKGVYSVDSWSRQSHDPDYLTIRIGFVAAPDNAGRLIVAAREELLRLEQEGASAEEIGAFRHSLRSAPEDISQIAERYLVYGSAVRPPASDAEVGAWLRNNLRGDIIDEYIRLPASSGPAPRIHQAAVYLDSASAVVGIELAGDAALAWQLEDSIDTWTWDRSDAAGKTVCFVSDAGKACQTARKGEISVFVIRFEGREHRIEIGMEAG